MTPRCPAYIGILPKGSGVSSLQAPCAQAVTLQPPEHSAQGAGAGRGS